jgi:hypothetical protein
MSTRSSVLVSLLAWAVSLVLGSVYAYFLSAPPEAPPAPSPQIAPAPAHINLDSDAILAQALASVEKLEWLAVEVRQKKRQGETRWSSEGTLQRGPGGCCRFEFALRTGSATPSRTLVVSDGKIVARITPVAGAKPKIESWPLPEEPAARTDILVNNGCGGPASVLAQAKSRGAGWVAQPAALSDRPGLALTGLLSALPTEAQMGSEPKCVRLFLDAETLWLTRAEWWSEHPERGGVLVYDIEFLRPRVNQPLSLEECGRVFSYQAD